MPQDKLPRFKIVRCRHATHGKEGKVIARFDRQKYHGHVPKEVILERIRRHYQKDHPKAFKGIQQKIQKTKKKHKVADTEDEW